MANDSQKIWGFALLKSETQTGLGKIMSNENGLNTTSFIQALIDFGIHTKITIRDIYGRNLYEWSIVFAREINRNRTKVIIRKLLAEVEVTKNYEMFVISGVEINPNGTETHVALDLDDSTQNGKYKSIESMKRWNLVEQYNYRAPPDIKYAEVRKDYRIVF